jgi:hypothetical protein
MLKMTENLKIYDEIMELAWEAAVIIDNGGEWPECIFTDPIDIELYEKEVKRLLKTAR